MSYGVGVRETLARPLIGAFERSVILNTSEVESRVSYPRLPHETCQAPTGRVGPATLLALLSEGLEGWVGKMANAPPPPKPDIDRYLVIHVATTCDEHGVYVTKDSAEVIEIGWLLLDAKNCEEVC